MVIREAQAEDVAAILSIYCESGIDGEAHFDLDEAIAHLESFRAYPNYRVFVAMSGPQIVGTYALLIMDNLAKRGVRSGIVEDVGVLPGQQGNGIGRSMMAHAMEECRAAGCYKLALSSNLRRTEAHEFYQALGFKRHGYSFVVAVK